MAIVGNLVRSEYWLAYGGGGVIRATKIKKHNGSTKA